MTDVLQVVVPIGGVAVEMLIDCDDGICRVPMAFATWEQAADGMITAASRLRNMAAVYRRAEATE